MIEGSPAIYDTVEIVFHIPRKVEVYIVCIYRPRGYISQTGKAQKFCK